MAGGMGKKQRKQVAEQITGLPDDQPRLILATGRYLGEGFDDPRAVIRQRHQRIASARTLSR
jgi:hypothetical protein